MFSLKGLVIAHVNFHWKGVSEQKENHIFLLSVLFLVEFNNTLIQLFSFFEFKIYFWILGDSDVLSFLNKPVLKLHINVLWHIEPLLIDIYVLKWAFSIEFFGKFFANGIVELDLLVNDIFNSNIGDSGLGSLYAPKEGWADH